MTESVDIAVVGAGAAGLMAAIQARRAAPSLEVLALDSAEKLGAKILISGGGRCNVTHDTVDERAFAGTSRNAIRKVLKRFDVPATRAFFEDLGVELKREETGKLFPVTNRARTVLDALLHALETAGAALRYPFAVRTIENDADGFTLVGPAGRLTASRVILATGGRSVPTTGSDGHGYTIARSLGHTTTARVLPALVPLCLPGDHPLCALRGVTLPTTLSVVGPTGRVLVSFSDSTLLTHFGLSGPSVLDVSRYYLDALADDERVVLRVSWLPGETLADVDRWLQDMRDTPARYLLSRLPERLARVLCLEAGVDPHGDPSHLTREQRRGLAQRLVEMELPITGPRGWNYAEVTAGGVPLSELHLDSMESRVCPGLFLCGEILDVDGRIGGFNFQWAWASGYVAGRGAARPRPTGRGETA